MDIYKELREISWECNIELTRHNLVFYTFGNVSAIDHEKGVFAIKPSGVPYDVLKVEDMVIVDLEANIINGKLRPSSDTRTHAALYQNFPEVGGIAHTHSTYATAWAQSTSPIPVLGTTHADYLAADIPCTEIMKEDMIRGD